MTNKKKCCRGGEKTTVTWLQKFTHPLTNPFFFLFYGVYLLAVFLRVEGFTQKGSKHIWIFQFDSIIPCKTVPDFSQALTGSFQNSDHLLKPVLYSIEHVL